MKSFFLEKFKRAPSLSSTKSVLCKVASELPVADFHMGDTVFN